MQKTFAWSLHEKYNRTPFLLNKISLKFYEKLINRVCLMKKLWYFSMYIERILDLTVLAKYPFFLIFQPFFSRSLLLSN